MRRSVAISLKNSLLNTAVRLFSTSRLANNVRRPTPGEVKKYAGQLGLQCTDEELNSFRQLMGVNLQAYDQLNQFPDNVPSVKYPRTAGYRPDPGENKYNAWYQRVSIKGAAQGPLLGKTIALKDNICLAGVPMMNGSATLEGFTPNFDATIVTRILDAGGTIKGKVHCESLCLSGGSHTNATGPVINPHKAGYSAGGSSSGSAVVVGLGEVDMAIGGDQGGSIRIPSSFSGTYGMKPTHGLVPYTGIMSVEPTLDHAGPITRTVKDNALLLSVIAGRDGLDHRQTATPNNNHEYDSNGGVRTMKIGVVAEGFGHPNSEKTTDEKVRNAAQQLKALGAQVEEISIPFHKIGAAIWTAIVIEGLYHIMMKGNGMGYGFKGLYPTNLMKAHAAWRTMPNELSESLKLCMLLACHMEAHYQGQLYGKAQNLSRKLTEAYDTAFHKYDLLLMPTTPMKATPIPTAEDDHTTVVQRALEIIPNTAPFDVTGHPAMNVPCGKVDKLPIGMMLVGQHFKEKTIYKAAAAFEASTNWLTR